MLTVFSFSYNLRSLSRSQVWLPTNFVEILIAVTVYFRICESAVGIKLNVNMLNVTLTVNEY